MRPSSGSRCSKSILRTTCLYFEYDKFDAGGPQSNFITSVPIAVAFEQFQGKLNALLRSK